MRLQELVWVVVRQSSRAWSRLALRCQRGTHRNGAGQPLSGREEGLSMETNLFAFNKE